MLGESQKRAAELAVDHYGVSPAALHRLLQALTESRPENESVDVLDALAQQELITSAQANEMRKVLQKTLIEPPPVKDQRRVKHDIYSAPTLPPEPETQVGVADVGPLEKRRFGDYRVLRLLGEGGMGSVYLAYHQKQDRHVAIKVLSNRHASNQTAVDRFYREAKSGALLNHPHIVRNFTVGQDRATGLHYLVMEYVDGPGVDSLLEKHGKLSVGDSIHIILDVARGLEHAHSRNIVHRDIKPANMLLTTSGLAKLSDMGLAKRTDEASHLTSARQGFGTPYYMPYEQAMNAKAADSRSDIFALGATLYHLLVGELPFPGNSPVEIVEKKDIGKYIPASVANPKVPKILDTILARMLAREPRHRYQTVSELIVDLERSRLAAPVPSFIDQDQAMRDPVVRQRLAMAMTAMQLPAEEHTPPETLPWYVRYRDEEGQWRKIKLAVTVIVERFRSGKLPADIEVSPHQNGDFRPLQAYSEFQELAGDLMRTRTPEEVNLGYDSQADLDLPSKSRKSLWTLAAITLTTILSLVGLTLAVFLTR